jgi:hypothetical protein
VFHELWMLVDGIYPSLSHFVKPLSVPVGDSEALFSLWQEAKHKDIERFSVFSKRSITSLASQFHLCTWKIL